MVRCGGSLAEPFGGGGGYVDARQLLEALCGEDGGDLCGRLEVADPGLAGFLDREEAGGIRTGH